MKKRVFAAVLCLILLTGLCSCGGNTGRGKKAQLTPEGLQKAATREELAGLLRVKKAGDLGQTLVYLRNFYHALPEEGASGEPVTAYSKTYDGYTSLSLAQAKTLITPVVVTEENWKDFIEARIDSVYVEDCDEEGNDISGYQDDPLVTVKKGYHYHGDNLKLNLVHKETGAVVEYSWDRWLLEVRYEDGKYYTVTWGEDGEEKLEEFNLDNYTCENPDAILYRYELAPELRYVEEWDDDLGYVYYSALEAEERGLDFDEDLQFVFIQSGDTNEVQNLCRVGYEAAGWYVYENTAAAAFVNMSGKEVTLNRVRELNLEALKKMKTREEVAAAIGVASTDDMEQMLLYLQNYYWTLPSKGDPTEPVKDYKTTAEGYPYLTVKEAKTLITPYVVTTENWTDFVGPYMQKVHHIEYDENDEMVERIIEEQDLGIDEEKYQFDIWGSIRFVFVNNKTGEVLEFTGRTWPESVSLEDGKIYTTSMSGEDFDTAIEYSPDNYTCVLADCILYTYELDSSLLYVEYLDEATEEWIMMPADEYEGEEAAEPMVHVQYGEKSTDITRVSYSSFGTYVYTECE